MQTKVDQNNEHVLGMSDDAERILVSIFEAPECHALVRSEFKEFAAEIMRLRADLGIACVELPPLRHELEAMRRMTAWMLGEEGEFPDTPEVTTRVIALGTQAIKDAGEARPLVRLYWWRGALRERWIEAMRLGRAVPVAPQDAKLAQ